MTNRLDVFYYDLVKEVLSEELGLTGRDISKIRLIDFDADIGVYSEGSIVSLDAEGVPIPPAYGGTDDAVWQIHGYFSGKALKVTVPPGGSKTVFVGASPAMRPGRLLLVETAFYLQRGLSATVTWGLGSQVNRTEEATPFRVTYEGMDSWNIYERSLPQEFFQTHNWVVFMLTNTSDQPKSMYVGRATFAELPQPLGYSVDNFVGYIPVTETSYTTKVSQLGAYAGWMGSRARYGALITLNLQSDGVNTVTARVRAYRSYPGASTVLQYSYSGATRSDSQFKSFIIDNRAYRDTNFTVSAMTTGGKGYIRRVRIDYSFNEQEPPRFQRYLAGSVTTSNTGTTNTFTILDFTTEPLPCQYAEIDHIEISPSGTSCTVCHINVDGQQASEDVPLGSTLILEDIKPVEKLELVANDAGTGATTVNYKIYYKLVGALLWR